MGISACSVQLVIRQTNSTCTSCSESYSMIIGRYVMLSNRDLFCRSRLFQGFDPGGQMPVKMSVQALFTRAVGGGP